MQRGNTDQSGNNPQGSGERLPYENVGGAHRKVWIKPLKESNLDVPLEALLDSQKIQLEMEMTAFSIIISTSALQDT